MPSGEVVGGILLPWDELLGVEQLAVGPSTNLVDHGGLQIHKDGPRHVLPRAGLAEEGVECIVSDSDRRVAARFRCRSKSWKFNQKKKKQNSIKKKILGDDAVGLDSVLQTVELPAGVAHLDPGLADVYADDLSHLRFELS